jgi:hypothetical protein
VIINQRVGHYFPTYVTPQVIVQISQADSAGKILPGTSKRAIIGRGVNLEITKELFDTRIAPDEARRFAYDEPLHPQAIQLHYKITVEPDAFYAKFYRANLSDPDFRKGRTAIQQALRNSEKTPYLLFETSKHIN